MTMRILRWAAIASVLIAYPFLVHYTSHADASSQAGQLGALLSIAPVVLIALICAWRSRARALMLSGVALLCAGLWLAWPLLVQHYNVVYWLQHAGMQLGLLAVFGRTLLPGVTPLCTRFARAVHAPHILSPRHERYAHHVTVAWTLFFAMMAMVSTVLFFLAPLDVWSLFANFMTLPLVILMFVLEYVVRHRAVPQAPRVHIMAAVRAFTSGAGRQS